jgi:hypothetical protein
VRCCWRGQTVSGGRGRARGRRQGTVRRACQGWRTLSRSKDEQAGELGGLGLGVGWLETRLQDVVLGRRAEFLSTMTLRCWRTSMADDEDAAAARRVG